MSALIHAVYGAIPRDLVDVLEGSVQCSPRHPGAEDLSAMAPESCAGFVMHAPASTLERRHELALALRALSPGSPLTVFAAKKKGGGRLVAELESFGCEAGSNPKRHHQIVKTARPGHSADLDEAIASAIAEGGPQLLPGPELWSQPGVFSWDRIDPGSQLLLNHLPKLEGRGADLGCGIGVLARAVIKAGGCEHISLLDIDSRAVTLAKRNNPGACVSSVWTDVRSSNDLPTQLDFGVSNPPFHDGGIEDRALGQSFIERAAGMLKTGGVLWLTANRHLPYEASLDRFFESVEQIAQEHGYKIYCATKRAVTSDHDGGRAQRSRR